MSGYVYVMSNEAMPGIYKIGCTSRSPWERAEELYTTGVPKPFIIEYCILIDSYQLLERRIHARLAKYNFNKEFFKLDLKSCILELKSTAIELSSYKEKYRSQHLRSQVEGWEYTYLRQKEAEERKRQEEFAAQEAKERREKWEQALRKKREDEKTRKGCTAFFVCCGIGILLSSGSGNPWAGAFGLGLGIFLYFAIVEDK